MPAESGAYNPVPVEEVPVLIDDGDDEEVVNGAGEGVEPLELDLSTSHREAQRDDRLFSWNDPWLLHTCIVATLMIPTLLGAIHMTYELTGRIWPAFLFSLHLTAMLWVLHSTLPTEDFTIPPPSLCRRIVPALLDVALFGKLYQLLCSVLIADFFTDYDGTAVIEYSHYHSSTQLLRLMGWTAAMGRLGIEVVSISIICYYRRFSSDITDHPQFPRMLATWFAWLEGDALAWSDYNKTRFRRILRWGTKFAFAVSVGLLLWSTNSVIVHWGHWSAPEHSSNNCDPLDTTECILPFPSFHFMASDETTDTGWRVNIHEDVLPRLKGGIALHPDFLNELDGFSTMAPLLFYVEGLKEAQEEGTNEARLQGHPNLQNSVTSKSITLLLDVENQKLVPHSAEIDYLDNDRPLVLVFPSQPLRHNAHYALAVVGARDVEGEPLPPTPGMSDLLSKKSTSRFYRYTEKVYPALNIAAPWSQSEIVQLIFDFQTVSERSQLGPIKAVRDATLAHVGSSDFWQWKDHVRVIRTENHGEYGCTKQNYQIARTVHAELDVPWFLQSFGSGQRGALLDKEAVANGKAKLMGKAHFVVHIPCSLRAAALQRQNTTGLRSVVEFGHGLFYNREEASWDFVREMANENGYIIMAMDWRGMSSYDLLVVVKTLMSKPSLFEAIRDNLIQGYANKLALQHFAKHGMLDMDWMKFGEGFSRKKPIPLFNSQSPSSVFYGISQGGILGAGYTTLTGPTKLIDRAILGVPGTPFALVMSRSRDFVGYDVIMLLNFYNNRHVRIFLSFAQMLWDSCEGAGLLAPPHLEEFPRMLLQAGLGDPIVPTLAAEALTRALGGVVLPNNPRQQIFDIPVQPAASGDALGPKVTLSELLFKKEYASLPVSDDYAKKATGNRVHWCVREDKVFISQVEEFINTGRIVDVCENGRCVRETSKCWDADYDDNNGK
jgi:hypothetical protein